MRYALQKTYATCMLSAQAIIVSLLLSGCGGGGGGGSSSSHDATGVRFIHAAIDQSPRQVAVDGLPVFSGSEQFVHFGSNTGFANVGSGVKNFALQARLGESNGVAPVQLSGDERVDLLLLDSSSGARAVAIKHPEVKPTVRSVRVVHGVRTSDGGIATVRTPSGELVSFGSASAYEPVVGTITVSINGAATTVALPDTGTLYTIVAVGESGYLTRALLLTDE